MHFFLIFLLTTISFCNIISKSNFDEFSNKFKKIDFPFEINDSLAFENWYSADLIEIDYVNEFNLITSFASLDYPLKSQDYMCSRIGKYEFGDFIVLLHKTYTTEAGSGNPKIILTIFTKTGEKKDEMIVLWDDAEDPLYNQRVTLYIPNNNMFSIKSLIVNNGYLQGNIVLKKKTAKITNYEIDRDGIIMKKKEAIKNIFRDDNPEILDDFPAGGDLQSVPDIKH